MVWATKEGRFRITSCTNCCRVKKVQHVKHSISIKITVNNTTKNLVQFLQTLLPALRMYCSTH